MCKSDVMRKAAEIFSFIKKLPPRHHVTLKSQVDSILKNYKAKGEAQTAIKQLDYRMNFLKLAFPDVKIGPAQSSSNEGDIDLIFDGEKFQLQQEQMPVSSQEGQKYHVDNGQLVRGAAPPRTHNQLLNWFGDNVDPEDLDRHRKLLARMNFKGQYWPQGRPKTMLQRGQFIKYQRAEGQPPQAQPETVSNEFKQVKR